MFMNEMLGNQYFLSGRYNEAAAHFEKSLLVDSTNNSLKKKLVICYIQMKDVNMALRLFTNLISENINVVLDSDPTKDDCPCQRLIYEFENSPSNLSENEKSTVLGILWLYCDRYRSQKYFSKLTQIDPKNLFYKKINQTIKNSFSQNIKEKQNGKKRYLT